MSTLVDANVLLDIFTDDPEWCSWSKLQLLAATEKGEVVINPIIYSEVSAAFAHEDELANQLERLQIKKAPLPFSAAFPCMRAFLKYRRSGGKKRSPLPDFFIGAQALVEKHTLLTRDDRRYRTYFPSVRLLSP